MLAGKSKHKFWAQINNFPIFLVCALYGFPRAVTQQGKYNMSSKNLAQKHFKGSFPGQILKFQLSAKPELLVTRPLWSVALLSACSQDDPRYLGTANPSPTELGSFWNKELQTLVLNHVSARPAFIACPMAENYGICHLF